MYAPGGCQSPVLCAGLFLVPAAALCYNTGIFCSGIARCPWNIEGGKPMPAITVRGVTLMPPRDTAPTNFKILVPVMANDLSNAAAAGAAGDVVELRLDALSILDAPNVQNVLCAARAAIGQGIPLLATIRTKKEGGLADLTDAAYGELGTAICTVAWRICWMSKPARLRRSLLPSSSRHGKAA